MEHGRELLVGVDEESCLSADLEDLDRQFEQFAPSRDIAELGEDSPEQRKRPARVERIVPTELGRELHRERNCFLTLAERRSGAGFFELVLRDLDWCARDRYEWPALLEQLERLGGATSVDVDLRQPLQEPGERVRVFGPAEELQRTEREPLRLLGLALLQAQSRFRPVEPSSRVRIGCLAPAVECLS